MGITLNEWELGKEVNGKRQGDWKIWDLHGKILGIRKYKSNMFTDWIVVPNPPGGVFLKKEK